MELLCNLAWLAVTVALWSCWFLRRRSATRMSLLPAIAVQLISLAALTAILLPVISISDDLQASNNPAEVERNSAKRNQFLCSQHAPHSTPGTIALIVPSLRVFLPSRTALLPVDSAVPAQGAAHLLTPWTRPPPAA